MNQSTVGAIINRPQKETGITLISLVVTIIILLILAGISIALISGSDGILGRATASVDKSNIETAKEQVTLKIGEYQSEFYEGKYVNHEIDNASEQGDWIFEKYGNKTLKVKDYEFTITLPEGMEKADKEHPYVVTIKKNNRLPGKVTGTLSVDGILQWDENFIADSSSEEKPNPDLPESPEGTDAGTIIKTPDSWMTEYILGETDKDKTESVKVATVDAVSDGNGNVFPVPKGFWYVGGNLDTGIIISDNEADKFDGKTDKTTWEYTTQLVGNQFVWIPCTENEYHKTNWGIQSDNWDTTIDMAGKIQTQKYGGFYVGRYEAGLADTIPEFTTTQLHNTSNQIYNLEGIPQSKAGLIPWMFIDWTHSKANAQNMYHTDYVTSGLITGTQWDVCLNKMIEKTDLTESDIKNSNTWGNFMNTAIDYKGRLAKAYVSGGKWWIDAFGEETEGTTTNYKTSAGDLLTTGASKITETYHLYDIAGNVCEWIEETSFHGGNTATQYRMRQGSACDGTAVACYRAGDYTDSMNCFDIRFSCSSLYKINTHKH